MAQTHSRSRQATIVILTRASSSLRFLDDRPGAAPGTVVPLFAFPPAIRDLHEQSGGAPEQHVGEQNRFIARNRVELGGIVPRAQSHSSGWHALTFAVRPSCALPLISSMIGRTSADAEGLQRHTWLPRQHAPFLAGKELKEIVAHQPPPCAYHSCGSCRRGWRDRHRWRRQSPQPPPRSHGSNRNWRGCRAPRFSPGQAPAM